jgi:hypothetical protein
MFSCHNVERREREAREAAASRAMPPPSNSEPGATETGSFTQNHRRQESGSSIMGSIFQGSWSNLFRGTEQVRDGSPNNVDLSSNDSVALTSLRVLGKRRERDSMSQTFNNNKQDTD